MPPERTRLLSVPHDQAMFVVRPPLHHPGSDEGLLVSIRLKGIAIASAALPIRPDTDPGEVEDARTCPVAAASRWLMMKKPSSGRPERSNASSLQGGACATPVKT